MSASDKKKLRKEQAAAAMTEKQKTEKKEQKKLKAYTVTFIIAMVLVVAIVLCAALKTPVSNALNKNTIAATVDEHKLSTVELSYYYIDAVSNFYSQFSSAGDYQDLYVQMYTGLIPSTALGDQVYDSTTGETWADYFIESAISSAKWTYAMYDKAMADGHTLTETEQSNIDAVESYMNLYATYYGYSNTDSYLRAMYGNGATLESYMEYYEISAIASSYASAYYDSLEFTDTDYREYEADKMNEFNSYSYVSCYVRTSNYYSGGTTTTNEDGTTSITYSDEEKKAAAEAALAEAEGIVASGAASAEDLELYIAKLENKNITVSENTAVLYSNLSTSNEDIKNWITSDERNAGDLTSIASTTEDSEGNVTTNGYYVLLFLECKDNTAVNVGNVRHLLVAFEGGTKDSSGNVTYSDEEKATAKKEAEELLAKYEAGEKTEEAFTALIKEHSDDTKDGLYENITPDSGYVTAFAQWATADHEVGDVDIIETEYGYHIMYYVGANELNYRDTLIDTALCEQDYTAWENDVILADVTAVEADLSRMNYDFTISG